MGHAHRPRARRRSDVPEEDLVAGRRYDYADSFEISLDAADPRTAEQVTRDALERSHRLVPAVIRVAQRHVLRLRLAPASAPGQLIGWRIAVSEPELLRLEATSPLLGRGFIVVRRPEPTRSVVTTYLFYARPRAAHLAWSAIGPLHRVIAPYLLERAATATDATV